MRHFSGSMQEKVKGDRMARARSAREGFAFAVPHWQDLRVIVGRHLPDAERLRRLVPLLLAGFAAVATIGFAVQLIQGKRAAFEAASQRLELIADSAASTLKDKTLKSSGDWQRALAESLPKGALADNRMIVLANAEGEQPAFDVARGAERPKARERGRREDHDRGDERQRRERVRGKTLPPHVPIALIDSAQHDDSGVEK